MQFLINNTHAQWHPFLENALRVMDNEYLLFLEKNSDWLPGYNKIFAAFTQPLEKLQYILLGESPYPRKQSANGYAFWDQAVKTIWSDKGLSKEVNRATSLRNMIKMLLLARGDLQESLSQESIAKLDKSNYCQTAEQLFNSFIDNGFLLLNASLVYAPNEVRFHAKHWQPFMSNLFKQMIAEKLPVKIILFGRIASQAFELDNFTCLKAEHPYNLSFITNPDVLAFFKPLDLLSAHE